MRLRIRHKIRRTTLMKNKRIMAVILAAGMAVSYLAGCSSAAAPSAVSGTETTAAAENTDTSTINIDAPTDSSSGESTAATSASVTEADLSTLTFDKVYGSQLKNFIDHQYKFNGKDVPLAESNFYIINAYVEITQYYGGYFSTPEGFLDLSAPYVDTTKFATFGDFLVSYAEKTIQSCQIICDKAGEEGLLLSDETKQQIDEMISNISKAATEGKLTLDQYLKLYYGEHCDEQIFRATLEKYYLTDLYSMKYCQAHITDEMRKAPNIRYALFEAPEATADAQAKSTSEGLAQDLVKAAGGSLDKLKTEAENSYAQGVCKETNDIVVKKGQTASAFESWAYDPSRKDGDIDVIYVPEFGYFVVGYIGTAQLQDQDLESDLIAMLSDEINAEISSGKYQFGTDMPYEPAKPISPTPTPEGYVDPSSPSVTTTPDITAAPGGMITPAPADNGNAVRSTAAIVAMCVGGVALIAAIVIITATVLKKMHGGSNRYRYQNEYDDDDEDDNRSEPPFEQEDK